MCSDLCALIMLLHEKNFIDEDDKAIFLNLQQNHRSIELSQILKLISYPSLLKLLFSQ